MRCRTVVSVRRTGTTHGSCRLPEFADTHSAPTVNLGCLRGCRDDRNHPADRRDAHPTVLRERRPLAAGRPPEDEPCYSEDFLARLRERDWLDGEYDAGRLAPYYDEYVISANHTILSHGRNLDAAYTEAERKADELGIPHGLLTNYFCDCA